MADRRGRTRPAPDDGGAARGALATRRSSEERYRFLDGVGQATRELADPVEIMAVTARLLGEHLGATRCAYADVEPDEDRFTIRSDWTAPGHASSAGRYSLDLFGPRARADMRGGTMLIVHDVDAELAPAEGREMFNAIGVKAIVCAPLVKTGRLVAMMAVHQAEPRRWSVEEVALVSEIVERCWAHIERVRAGVVLREQFRRKSEFLAILAHELRNPLAPMRYGLAVLARTLPSDHPSRRAHAIMDRQVASMSRLVDDLLDVSRIERGLVELRPEPLELTALVSAVLEASGPIVETAGHALEVRLPPEPIVLVADPIRIAQVLNNLLHNAAKYTPRGGHLELSAEREADRLAIRVRDDGIGIPREMLTEIFEDFRQLPGNGALAQGGLGIGLSLAKRLVELHGGAIEADSAGPSRGSVFTVRLPLPSGG